MRLAGHAAASLAFGVFLLCGFPTAADAQEPLDLRLQVVRFWHASGRTIVHGTFRVPLSLLETPAATALDSVAYLVRLSVEDSSGLTLYREAWRQGVASQQLTRVEEGLVGESFAFAVGPGQYRVRVEVEDSLSSRIRTDEERFRAYAEAPRASDLVAANEIRRLEPGAVAERGVIEKSALAISTDEGVTISANKPVLYYYAEAYPAQGRDSAEVQLQIVSVEGKPIVTTRPAVRSYSASGGMETGQLDVRGLPPGEYRLVLRLVFADSVVERRASFTVKEDSPGDRTPSLESSSMRSISDRFARVSESALDSLFGPVGYFLESSERAIYSTLAADGKRRFLTHVFHERDPTPGTPRNEFEEEFFERVDQANEKFGERGSAGRPGWITDRGRVYIRYGVPDDEYVSPGRGGGRAWELWKYTSGGQRLKRYVFWDETGFENYVLVYTDNRNEPSRPNWETIVGAELAEEILRYF